MLPSWSLFWDLISLFIHDSCRTTPGQCAGTSAQPAKERQKLKVVQTWTRYTCCLHLIHRHWFIRMRHCLSSFHLMLHLMTLADAVLSYQMGGHFRPVAFASCTLTQAQRSYSQLGKASRPHCFLIETISPFSLWSLLHNSNWSLAILSLFGRKNPNTVHAAARLQRLHWLYPRVTQLQES